VRRELGIPIPRRTIPLIPLAGATTGIAATLAAIWLIPDVTRTHRWPWQDGPPPPPPPADSAGFTFMAEPDDAMIYLDDHLSGRGTIHTQVEAGKTHIVRVTAPGYADSQWSIPPMTAGQDARDRVVLRPLFGDLRVETEPPGAAVRVDGVPCGPSPATAPGLAVGRDHRVEATLTGYGAARTTASVKPNQVTPVSLSLTARTADLSVTSDPASCAIQLDASPRGLSGRTLRGIPFGSHEISASREGYVRTESTLVVSEPSQHVHLVLRPEPPGIVIVQGDHLADIYIGGNLVKSDAQNSGPQSLSVGTYLVQVILKTGVEIDTSLVVKSQETATFDYSRGTVTRQQRRGP